MLGLSHLTILGDDAEDVLLQETVVELQDGGMVELGEQLGLRLDLHCLVGVQVTHWYLLQHLAARAKQASEEVNNQLSVP